MQLVEFLPFLNTLATSGLVLAFFRLSFQAGSLVRHVDAIDERVKRLENHEDKGFRVVVAAES